MPASDLIFEHYLQFNEDTRLTGPFGEFEFARTRELIARHLPISPIEIIGVGGGTGAYSFWLAGLGHLAVAINRYAGVIYGLTQGLVFEPPYYDMTVRELSTGVRNNPPAEMKTFREAYFHLPTELIEEM